MPSALSFACSSRPFASVESVGWLGGVRVVAPPLTPAACGAGRGLVPKGKAYEGTRGTTVQNASLGAVQRSDSASNKIAGTSAQPLRSCSALKRPCGAPQRVALEWRPSALGTPDSFYPPPPRSPTGNCALVQKASGNPTTCPIPPAPFPFLRLSGGVCLPCAPHQPHSGAFQPRSSRFLPATNNSEGPLKQQQQHSSFLRH